MYLYVQDTFSYVFASVSIKILFSHATTYIVTNIFLVFIMNIKGELINSSLLEYLSSSTCGVYWHIFNTLHREDIYLCNHSQQAKYQ